ncbi:hypothetical protein T11_14814 [Trichinella zimbabwensis]|uniref:Uncharacterized protein n=1 Tax=Trichinella zimbabwensis TaxID=268475 RepID=A0A0V1G934_9BILA|nr:hypothetical protein T11_14814 [Trichinella zimbabwensis]
MICAASLGIRCVEEGVGLDLTLHVLINVAWLR